MMKYGKSISVKELFEPVLCALRCRWRRKQALLLLSLQTGEVAYWQNGEHSWQEQLNEECLADKQRLTDALREILLARDVEEGGSGFVAACGSNGVLRTAAFAFNEAA